MPGAPFMRSYRMGGVRERNGTSKSPARPASLAAIPKPSLAPRPSPAPGHRQTEERTPAIAEHTQMSHPRVSTWVGHLAADRSRYLPPRTAPTAATATTAAAPLRSRAAFSAAIMPGIPDMSSPIPSLIRMEVVERPLSTPRHRA
jgi:hypothetical protein